MTAKVKDTRTKNWVAIMYPESMPSDWQTRLANLKTNVIISPLHDKDVNADGTAKKPHYHVILMFSSNKSFEQVKTLLEPFKCPIPQKVTSIKGQVRYLIHIDNPEKYQYDKGDIQTIGDVDLLQYFSINSSQRYNLIAEMMDFVDDNLITEFSQLMKYSRRHRQDDWFPLLCDNSAYVMDKYITSFRNQNRGIDPIKYFHDRTVEEPQD